MNDHLYKLSLKNEKHKMTHLEPKKPKMMLETKNELYFV
jgi:hypothetical protein